MSEIGGYLEFEHYKGKEYHIGCLKLNTARNCLRYLIEAKSIKKLWISRWNCQSVFDACAECNVDIHFYDLDDNFIPILPKEYCENDYIYVVNYFGQLSNYRRKNMILDNVQAFFEKPKKGVDTIYSCRKFFGVTDGAYLYTDCTLNREIERDCSGERVCYLVGRYEKEAAIYYNEYKKNEKALDDLSIKHMSLFTENIMKSIDYKRTIKQRNENFSYLNNCLSKINLLKAKKYSGPFAYPLMVNDGDNLRKKLISDKIYIAKLWPNVSESREKRFAENILPLPCDQRYKINDMKYIVESVYKYYDLRN